MSVRQNCQPMTWAVTTVFCPIARQLCRPVIETVVTITTFCPVTCSRQCHQPVTWAVTIASYPVMFILFRFQPMIQTVVTTAFCRITCRDRHCQPMIWAVTIASYPITFILQSHPVTQTVVCPQYRHSCLPLFHFHGTCQRLSYVPIWPTFSLSRQTTIKLSLHHFWVCPVARRQNVATSCQVPSARYCHWHCCLLLGQLGYLPAMQTWVVNRQLSVQIISCRMLMWDKQHGLVRDVKVR